MTNRTRKFLLDVAERAAKVFVYAYLACWVGTGGTQFDTLFTEDNLEAGVVGLALSLAVSLGIARHVGAENTASLLPAGPDTDRG